MERDEAREAYLNVIKLWQASKYDEALIFLDALYHSFPDDKDIVYAKAQCLVSLGRKAETLELCKELSERLGDPRGAKLAARIAAGDITVAEPLDALEHPRARRLDARAARLLKIGSAFVAAVIVVVLATRYFGGEPTSVRVIRFPDDGSLGALYLREPGAPDDA